MDAQALINAEIAVAILIKDSHFALIPLTEPTPQPDPALKGFAFAGILAVVRGRVSASLEMELDLEQITTIGAAFRRYVEERLAPDPLERLWSLPDSRSN